MVNGETIEAIRSEAIKHYAWDSSAHDQLHAERVLRLSMRILEKEGGDPEILAAAALLHDIGMKYEIAEDFDHAEKSAELAEQILLKIGFPKEKIPEVVDIIRIHRFSRGIKALSLEAKILQDADRLDAIGAVGIARAFACGAKKGVPMYSHSGSSTLNHFNEKLLKIKDSLNTETARRIAEERHEFTQLFLKKFLNEVEGGE